MERITENIRAILDGKSVQESEELCDFTLEMQNEVTASKGIAPLAPSSYKPVVKKSVTYIVAALLFDDNGDILMMQEAKSTCAGQWYLPAGRMESGENIIDAFKREVLEETGLEASPTTLLMVESASGSWYRFIITGKVTGGKLKTPADADSESLQAKWIKNLNELVLRSHDILPVIEKGRQYNENDQASPWHFPILPDTDKPHEKLLLRCIICVRKKANNQLNVLVSEKTEVHLPLCEINPARSVHSTLKKYMIEIFGADLPQHKPHGLLSIEHNGIANTDGLCFNLLISVRQPLEEVHLIDKYSWLEIEQSLAEALLERFSKNKTISLNVIR